MAYPVVLCGVWFSKKETNSRGLSLLKGRRGLVAGLGDREADVMVEAKGKKHTRSSLWA